MVAFCASAAIVTKVGFWLIAIVIAGWAGGVANGYRNWEPSALGWAVLMRLADVQVYCIGGRRNAGVCFGSFGVLKKLKQTP